MSIRGRTRLQLIGASISMACACVSVPAAADPTVGPLMQLEGPSVAVANVARSSGGNFLLAWNPISSTGQYGPAQVQAFSVGGTPVTPILSVGSSVAGPVSLAMDKNGDFVVAWTEGEGIDSPLYAQRYSATGAAQGAKRGLGTAYNGPLGISYYCGLGYVCGRSETTGPLQVAMDDNGDFAVGWTASVIKSKTAVNGSSGSCTATNKTYAAAYSASGAVKSYKHVIDSVDAIAGMTMNGSGTLAALFNTGPCKGAVAQKVAYYTSNLVPTVTAQISTVIAGVNPAGGGVNAVQYGIDASGNLTILWEADQVERSLAFAQFDSSGNPVGTVQGPIGDPMQVYSTLAVAPAGNFAIGWSSVVGNGNNSYTRNMQYFAADGSPTSDPFVVDNGLDQFNTNGMFSAFDGNGTLLTIWDQLNTIDDSVTIVGRIVTN